MQSRRRLLKVMCGIPMSVLPLSKGKCLEISKDGQAPTKFGRTYYVSLSGDDNNDGLSQKSAWKTCQRAFKSSFLNGDAVLFERGGVFNGAIEPKILGEGALKISSYGSGPNPIIHGLCYLDPQQIKKIGINLWKIGFNNPQFNGKFACLFRGDIENLTVIDNRFDSISDLKKNYDFTFNKLDGCLILYFDGDVASKLVNLSASFEMNGVVLASGLSVEGLDIIGFGGHGIIGRSYTHNVSIDSCKIAYIGGAYLQKETRYGNGIQIWKGGYNINISNNIISDVYDAAITLQGDSISDPKDNWKDINILGNKIYRSSQMIEIWSKPSVSSTISLEKQSEIGFFNVSIKNNYSSMIGLGWGGKGRGKYLNQCPILFYNMFGRSFDIEISKNKFDSFKNNLFGMFFSVKNLRDLISFSENQIHFSSRDDLICNSMSIEAGNWDEFFKKEGIGKDCIVTIG
jgi:hypothetical protein